MGCLGIALISVLAFAIPASIARTSLIGAFVVLLVLAAAGTGAVLADARRRRTAKPDVLSRTSTRLAWVGGLTLAYAVAVTVINRTG